MQETTANDQLGFNLQDHIKLVYLYVNRFMHKHPTFQYLTDELTADCLEHMVKASKKHDPSKGTVSTFCWHYFRTATKKCLARTGSAVTSPLNNEYATCRTIEIPSVYRALERKRVTNEDNTAAMDLAKILKTLPKRTADILILKYGLFGNKSHTDQEIGDMLGVTRQRVHKLRSRTITELQEIYSPISEQD